jgi:heme o synthase
MEKIAKLERKSALKNYIQLTKPGIVMGNAVTAVGGFMLASQGPIQFSLLTAMLIGLSLIIASACICNNYIDRDLDKKMKRTQHRVFARGVVTTSHSLLLALFFGSLGTILLCVCTTFLTTVVALLGFFIYVGVYSTSKYLTSLCTLIGSIAGAVPPVVGYTAVVGQLDLCALLLFLTIALWQMPHFFAIALYRLSDYQAAAIPVLPVKKGILATKVQILVYIIAFIIASALLSVYDYTGSAYLITTLIMGALWVVLAIQGFFAKKEEMWARLMFISSLVVVMSLCGVMCLSIA